MDKIKAYYDNDRFLPILVKELTDYAIFLMTTDGLVASWNEGAELIKGYKKEDILGKYYGILFPERLQKEKYPEKEIETAIKNGRFEDHQWRKRKNGEEFWAKVVLIPLYDENNSLLGLAKITQDLTKEKAVEDELKNKSEEYRHAKEFGEAILDTITEGIAVLNKKGIIVNANEVFNKLFNMEGSSSIGKKLSEISRRLNEPETKKLLDEMISENLYFKKKEIDFIIDNEQRVYSLTSRFIYHNQNTDLKVLLAVNDVTSEKQIETARKDFASFISHELRTPITIIKSNVQLVLKCIEENKDCNTVKHLNKTLQFVDTLNSMIQEFHESNKAVSDKIQIEKSKFNIEELINDTIESMQLAYPKYKITKHGTADVIINADPVRITQVLTNYIINAIKYSEGKEINVILRLERKKIRVEVIDKGPGISEQERKKLFSRYFRIKQTSKKEGLGMGLFLVKKIIEAHNGDVGVRSEPGKGSTFYFSIPLTEQ